MIKFIRIAALFFLTSAFANAEKITRPQKIDVVTYSSRQQFDEVAPGGKSAIAIDFDLQDGWHFYASPDTAPVGMNLKLEPNEQGTRLVAFDNPVWPKAGLFHDAALDKNLDVFSGKFTVYLPFSVSPDANLPAGAKNIDVKISIEGAVCSESQCRVPNFGDIETTIKIARDANNLQPAFVLPESPQAGGAAPVKTVTNYSIWAALVLAFVAGLSLNIMPCVWPVLPIIIMRLVENAKESKGKSIVMGLAFCIGILVFFACLAGANIILHIFYGQVLQWGDQLRNPAFLIAMAMLLIVLALFMFGVFSLNLPSSLGGKSGSGQGLGGAVGMGFLAAILSTPCSFGILAAVFAWAQTQPLVPATLAIMIIGIGMATPFLVLTAVPALLKKAPRPGRWMELFKQTIGFVLLVIAVKLIASLPGDRRVDVLYFAIVLAFSVWMWGGWVSFSTPAFRKWVVRIIAAALSVVAGFIFLKTPLPEMINWQKYDSAAIDAAVKENRPVLIDFTAGWCLSCQVVDKTVYSRKDIADLIKQNNVYAVKADTTLKDYPATKALEQIYHEPGVPVSILILPGKEPVRWRGLSFGDELKSALEKPSK